MMSKWLSAAVLLSLMGCNGTTTKVSISNEDDTSVAVFQATSKVQFQFNLSSTSQTNYLDPQFFSFDDPLSYSSAVSTMVCQPSGERIELGVFFLQTSDTRWELIFRLNDEGVNVSEGEFGALGLTTASLEFDPTGNFVRQYPYIIQTETLSSQGLEYEIELDFYTSPSTSLDAPFNAMKLDVDGC